MTKPVDTRPKATNITDPELRSMARIVKELTPFDRPARGRILDWLSSKMDTPLVSPFVSHPAAKADAEPPPEPDGDGGGDSFDTDY